MQIFELLSDLNIPFRQHGESPHVTEGWVGLQCHFCNRGPGEFRLGYNLRTGWMSCWSCGPHRLSEAIAETTGLRLAEARKLTEGLERARVDWAASSDTRGKLELPAGVGHLGPAHRDYLARRGFDPDELAETWRVGGIGVAARLAWRLFIPIHHRHEVVSWTTRAVGDVPLPERYRGAKREQEVYPRKVLLYGADRAKSGIVVVEGPTDVWAIGPGAVCTFGTGFSRAAVRRMGRFPVRAICFDNEPAAQRRAAALAAQLEVLPGETYVVQLTANDAASALRECPGELEEVRSRFLR